MIIDCHGHYTTEPKVLLAFGKLQVDAMGTNAPRPAKASLNISDDEIRQSIEGAQLDPEPRHYVDDTKRYVDALPISTQDKQKIFEGNARRVFPRLAPRLVAQDSAR